LNPSSTGESNIAKSNVVTLDARCFLPDPNDHLMKPETKVKPGTRSYKTSL